MNAYTRILCPLDASDRSRVVLRYAAAASRWYGAKLIVLHIVPERMAADVVPSLVGAHAAADAAQARSHVMAESLIGRMVAEEVPPGTDVEWHVEDSADVTPGIIADAAGFHAHLVVMGSHGRTGWNRVWRGSTAETVIRAGAADVLIVPPHAVAPVPVGGQLFDRLLCAIDLSPQSVAAAAAALALAEDTDGHLTLLNVADVPMEFGLHAPMAPADLAALHAGEVAARRRRLQALVPPAAGVYCHVEAVVREGQPAEAILRLAAERRSDLIILFGRQRRTMTSMLLGSTIHAVLLGATCPVLVVREG